ncbi:hypothetical protein K474DRAFT_1709590 [Panus rudis PR-1116 ss-1]|nr:hypothetical protein K474DRAFT_1709590 [Panus rudis PR-1116 ss-1]
MFSKLALAGVATLATLVSQTFAAPNPDLASRDSSPLFKLTALNVLNANNSGDADPQDIFVASLTPGDQQFAVFTTFSSGIEYDGFQIQDGKLLVIKDSQSLGGAGDPSASFGGGPVNFVLNTTLGFPQPVYSIAPTPIPTSLLAIHDNALLAWQLCHALGHENPKDQLVVFNPVPFEAGGPSDQPFEFSTCHTVVLQLTFL